MSNIEVVIAPEHKHFPQKSLKIFLAGGICKCIEWQKKITDALVYELQNYGNGNTNIYLLNPRREKFVMADGETTRQIEWEFDMIETCDIFTMYFAGGESDQPICMYELGRNIERMKAKFPLDWKKRIVITCDDSYKRLNDVLIQVRLATEGAVIVAVQNGGEESVKVHKSRIIEAIKEVDISNFKNALLS